MTKKIEIEILLILFSLFAGTVKGQESMQQRISNIDIFALNLNLCEDILYCPPPRISCIDFFNNMADME